MLRIRQDIKQRPDLMWGGGHSTKEALGKLEKLMMRISAFSVMYIAPAVLTIAITAYQSVMMPTWLRSWYNTRCEMVRSQHVVVHR